MKTYRRHNCSRRHRTYRTLANCIWPRAAWVQGDGAYASLAHCHVLTVWLYDTLEEAEHAKWFIDWHGCGGKCSNHHEIVCLVAPEDATRW
jgi:hypothetical protein